MSPPKQQTLRLLPGDIVMLYSDGIREHFEHFDVPGLLTGNARDIVLRVLDAFSKGNDDTSCLVMRYV